MACLTIIRSLRSWYSTFSQDLEQQLPWVVEDESKSCHLWIVTFRSSHGLHDDHQITEILVLNVLTHLEQQLPWVVEDESKSCHLWIVTFRSSHGLLDNHQITEILVLNVLTRPKVAPPWIVGAKFKSGHSWVMTFRRPSRADLGNIRAVSAVQV